MYFAEILPVVEDTNRTRGTFALVHAVKAYKGVETAPPLQPGHKSEVNAQLTAVAALPPP